jgi:hypothetical protein
MNAQISRFPHLACRLLLGPALCLSTWTTTALPARTASAQAAQAGPEKADKPEYQNLVQKGLREYELGNFSEAKSFFQQAHQLSPNARTLRGLGMTSYELRRYVEAIDHFQAALASSERPLTPQMRSEVTQLLHQARSFVTKLTLTVTPPDAEARLDNRVLARDQDGTILLDPGTHELVVEAPEHETITRSIRADGGEPLSLTIALRSSLQPAAAASEPAAGGQDNAQPFAAAQASTSDEPQSSGSAGPWIVIGASAAVAVAGGVLLAVALSNKSAVENPQSSDPEGPRYADFQGKADTVLPLSAIGITALSLGVAGAAAGLTWKLLSTERNPSSTPESGVSATLSVAPGALWLHGRY